MEDPLGSGGVERAPKRAVVAEVGFDATRLARQPIETRRCGRGSHHRADFVPVGHEPTGQVKPEEAGRARDQDSGHQAKYRYRSSPARAVTASGTAASQKTN